MIFKFSSTLSHSVTLQFWKMETPGEIKCFFSSQNHASLLQHRELNLPSPSLTSAILCFCSLLYSIYTPRNYNGWKATGSAIWSALQRASALRLGQTLLLLHTNANQATLKGNFGISLFGGAHGCGTWYTSHPIWKQIRLADLGCSNGQQNKTQAEAMCCCVKRARWKRSCRACIIILAKKGAYR